MAKLPEGRKKKAAQKREYGKASVSAKVEQRGTSASRSAHMAHEMG